MSRKGRVVWTADSLPVSAVMSLSERLFWENSIVTRQNAPGTLSTISARGAGPNRTPVIWNGINLQSPMNGVVDASLLPLWKGDKLTFVQGGQSAVNSSGAMGGNVLIDTRFVPQTEGLSASLGADLGSYQARDIHASGAYSNGSFGTQLRGQWQQAKNNFAFPKTGLDGRQYTAHQENNFGEKSDIQQTNFLKINSKNTIRTVEWYQQAFRQIPPALTETASDTWQRDRAFRAIATWEHREGKRAIIQTRGALLDEHFAFHFAEKTEQSGSKTALVSSEAQVNTSKWLSWKAGGMAQHVRAMADGYQIQGKWYAQTRLAVFGTGTFQAKNGSAAVVSVRQEWADDQGAPFTWSVGGEAKTGKNIAFRGHISRNFTLPTFNDRFWQGLGNNNLKPEKGYSGDVGITLKNKRFSVELTGFQLLLDDWILWQPGIDGIFRPGNLRKVSSRGVEGAGQMAFSRRNNFWRIQGHFQWSATRNVEVYGGSENALGKLLPYTPQVTAGGGVWFVRKNISAAYLHQFTGKRYATTDNLVVLPNFQTGAVFFQYTVKNARFAKEIAINLRIENIWNAQYESLQNRPMPGSNGRLGIACWW